MYGNMAEIVVGQKHVSILPFTMGNVVVQTVGISSSTLRWSKTDASQASETASLKAHFCFRLYQHAHNQKVTYESEDRFSKERILTCCAVCIQTRMLISRIETLTPQ